MKKLLLITFLFSFLGCSKEEENPNTPSIPPTESTPNILLIIADDLGKDAMSGFSEGSIKPNTPNIDAIRNAGLSFNNFWAYPTCSPTRASIITGKYGLRTGVHWPGDELDLSETILQKYLSEQTNDKYSTAMVGKWHLSGNNESVDPETFGIDYFAGLIRGEVQSYYNWEFSENGVGTIETAYTTRKFTDLAIDWINDQEKPWFMWLAHNAPHKPFHVPPNGMHSQGNLPEYMDGMDPMPYYMAAIEALDFQIGRLLDNIPPDERENTIMVFIGDNGTPNEVAQAPFLNTTVKGTLFQGGINVPMFISGKGVSRTGEDDNLITSTDIFATIADLAGVAINEIYDSKSFKSLFTQSVTIRNFQYAEKSNDPVDKWAISNGSYKLIESANGNQELYDLNNDPYEQNNLLNGNLTPNETTAKSELQIEVMSIRN